jgi:hypothetical protein
VTTILPATKWSTTRAISLESSLVQTHGPSAMYSAARAWTRLQAFLLTVHATGTSADAMPSPEDLKAFLEHHSKDVNTGPHNLWKGLSVCEQRLGIPLPMADVVLAAFRSPPKLHEVEQRPSLQASAWKHLVDIAETQHCTDLRTALHRSTDSSSAGQSSSETETPARTSRQTPHQSNGCCPPMA